MKKISVIALVLAFCMCFCLLAGCGAKDNKSSAPKGMKLASGENVDYCMYVPENWKVDKSDLYTSAYFSSGDATSISVTAYGVGSEEETVGDWWKKFEKEIGEVYKISDVKETKAKLDGIKGSQYSFKGTLADNEYNFIITAILKDYYVYYITYTSTPEFYEDHLEELDQVIEAFEFKD